MLTIAIGQRVGKDGDEEVCAERIGMTVTMSATSESRAPTLECHLPVLRGAEVEGARKERVCLRPMLRAASDSCVRIAHNARRPSLR
jgi:hypothetical protein